MLGKALLSDSTQTASNDAAPMATEQQADLAPADLGDISIAAADKTAGDPVRVVGNPDAAVAQTEAGTEPAAAESFETTEADGPGIAPAATAGDAGQQTQTGVATTDGAVPSQAGTETPPAANAATTATVPAQAAAPAPAAIDIPGEAGPQALRDAAAEGDAKALFEIGSRYAEGRGVKEDMAAAAKWYEKSAELGFAPAEYRIGNFYEKGIGVARDIQRAKTWYQLSAGQGNASAMHNLAVLFAMAADGVTDNESAVRWFQAAADLGVKDSQFNLGILAAKGVGMKQNLEEAYKWFALVANTGDKDAASKRDEIADALRPEQLEHARAAAALWKAKPVDQAVNSADIPESWQEGNPATTTASIDMKKAVQNIQKILNKNGYDAGGADGVMGQRTKNAIMAFQSDNELAPTGEVDEKLVKALLAKK